jgi:hypothetical protein
MNVFGIDCRQQYFFGFQILFLHFGIYSLSDSSAFILQGLSNPIFKKSPTFLSKTLDKPIKKCGASRLLITKNRPLAAVQNF